MSIPSPGDAADREETRRRAYERLRNVIDEDAVHDLIARHGPQILDRDLPFLIVAARNQLRSRLRHAQREHLALQMPELADPSGDAYDVATGRIGVDALLAALAGLDPRDTFVLWRFAEGVPDYEVAAEWEARKLGTPLSAAALRKRRERARERLRSILAPGPTADGD